MHATGVGDSQHAPRSQSCNYHLGFFQMSQSQSIEGMHSLGPPRIAHGLETDALLYAGLSSAEEQRFSNEDSWGSPLFDLASTDSNTWVEVNYTQLVANAQKLLPQVKPGTIAMAMVKVGFYPILLTPPLDKSVDRTVWP